VLDFIDLKFCRYENILKTVVRKICSFYKKYLDIVGPIIYKGGDRKDVAINYAEDRHVSKNRKINEEWEDL
jgi:hypothetical protein